MPIIKANTNQARIYEEGNSVSDNKLTSAKTIKFKTDIDSIIFKLKPGEKKDFIVLLKGKDSCLIRIETPEIKNFSKVKPEIHDTIPLVINAQNTMYVPVVLNQTDTLNLNFDTGTTELMLTMNKPMKNTKLHFLGNEVLKRFNSIIDFQENMIYMKPNHLYSSGYMEEIKNSKPDN